MKTFDWATIPQPEGMEPPQFGCFVLLIPGARAAAVQGLIMREQIATRSGIIGQWRKLVSAGRHQVVRKFKTGYKLETKVINASKKVACSVLFPFNV
mgnify:CR=1 FL=1